MSRKNKQISLLKLWPPQQFYQSQQKEEKVVPGIIEPEMPFSLLVSVVNDSFIIGWIIDKIATNADSWFKSFTETITSWYDTKLIVRLESILKDLDVKHAIANIATCGNYWLEITWWQEQQTPWNIDLIPFLTHECKLKADWTLMQINSHGEKAFTLWKYVHLKTRSLKTRYYGDSIFSKCVRQIVVLDAIDKHYERFFDHGMINTKLLMDVNGELWPDSIKIIQETIKDRLRGEDNSFTTAIIPTELKQLDLENQVDVQWLLQYRVDLIKAICVALNMPYDMLITDSSNRATSEISQENFNRHVVKPLQEQFIKQLRKWLRPYFGDIVDHIELKSIDTKNQLEEMQILTWYKNAGVFTANMVLEQLGYDPLPGGDVLETVWSMPKTADEINQINKIKQNLKQTYAWLLWNDHQDA